MSEQQTGQPWWVGLPDDVEPATDTQLANVVRNGTVPGRGSRVLLPWPLMLRVLRRLAVRDDVLAEKDAEVENHRVRAARYRLQRDVAEADNRRLREALAKVEALADLMRKIDREYHEGIPPQRPTNAVTAVSVAARIDSILASVPAVGAGDREPAREDECCAVCGTSEATGWVGDTCVDCCKLANRVQP